MSKEKLSTPPKTHVSKSSIFSLHLCPQVEMNLDNPSEQMEINLQEITKVNNIHAALRTSSKRKSPTETGKRCRPQIYPFATHLDVNSLEGFKKKCLKATIKAPL